MLATDKCDDCNSPRTRHVGPLSDHKEDHYRHLFVEKRERQEKEPEKDSKMRDKSSSEEKPRRKLSSSSESDHKPKNL